MSVDIYGTAGIKKQAANQCAPVFAGVKPSNIFITGEGTEEEVIRILTGTGLKSRKLYEGEGRRMYLFYREEMLKQILLKEQVGAFFEEYGYNSMDIDAVLDRIISCYNLYKSQKRDFPHEIGLLLGYPLCDVKGFIEHKGADFLFSGYWKVYENAEETKRLFDIYTAIKEMVLREVEKGLAFGQIVSMFQKKNIWAA